MTRRTLTKNQHIAVANSLRSSKAELRSLKCFLSAKLGKTSKLVAKLDKAENALMLLSSDLENLMFEQLGADADGVGYPHYNAQSLTEVQKALQLNEVELTGAM